MRTVARVVLFGVVLMSAAIAYGFAMRGGWAEVGRIVSMPWGLVTMVDIYVGFALFCGWIWYRETSRRVSLIWTILVLLLGNFLTCIYVLVALKRSGGDWRRFWLGKHV